MQLMGKNLANYKKSMKRRWTLQTAVHTLLQMLEAIQQLHDEGYIHRDIKPSNFVVGLYARKHDVFMVDFGLAKQHLDKNGVPHEIRKNTDFRGTITYASLDAHNKVDLARRDDMWSFYFVVLDFLNEELPWRACKPPSPSLRQRRGPQYQSARVQRPREPPLAHHHPQPPPCQEHLLPLTTPQVRRPS